MKKTTVVLAIITGFFGLGCGQEFGANNPVNKANSEYGREFIARAEFASLEEVYLNPPMTTEILELVPEGSQTSAGKEVAKLSPGDRLERIMEESAELERLSMSVDLEKMRFRMGRGIEDKKLELARLDLEKNKVELERAIDGRDWLRIVELEESLKTEKIKAKLLDKQFEASKKMVGKGFASRQELLETEKELSVLHINASLTARLIPFLDATPEEKKVQQARENYEKSLFAYELASYTYAKNIAEFDFAEKEGYRNYLQNASSVALLEKQVASLSVIAEKHGVVIYGNSYDGAEMVKIRVGSQVYPGLNFLRIVNPEKSGVVFAISPKERSLIQANKEFFFRPDSFPENLLSCKLRESIYVALQIPGGRPEGRTQIVLQADIASYPENFKLGYSGTVMPKEFVENTISRISSNKRFTVTRKALARKTSTTGDIKPASFTYIVSYVEGKLNSLEEEGKTVEPGQVIATVDCEETAQSARDVEIELKKKKEELLLLVEKNSLEEGRLIRESEVKSGALEVAKLKHATLLKSRDEDKIIDLKRSLELIEAKIDLAKEKVAHIHELNKKGLRSELEVMQAENEVSALMKDKAISHYKLRLEESGPTPRSVKLSELEVQKAEVEKQKSEQESSLGRLVNTMKLKILELEIRKLEITLAKLNKKVEKAELKSPSAGVIILNETHKESGGLGKARVGDTIYERVPFMQIADMGNLQIHTDVSEMDAKFIKLGDEVKVFLKGNSVGTHRGWISSIGYIAKTEFKTRQDAVVAVTIDLLSEKHGVKEINHAFRPGASCEVEFSLYNLENALYIPFDAIIPTATETCVMTTSRELVPVKLNFSDGLNGAVVNSGIDEGQEILLMEAVE